MGQGRGWNYPNAFQNASGGCACGRRLCTSFEKAALQTMTHAQPSNRISSSLVRGVWKR